MSVWIRDMSAFMSVPDFRKRRSPRLLPGQQPGSNLGDRLFLKSGTDINADMSRIQTDILGIPAPNLFRQDFACLRGHQVVVLTIDIQQRHGDPLEIYEAPPQ